MRSLSTKVAVLAGTALIASTVIGVNIYASGGAGGGLSESTVAGVPVDGEQRFTEAITTSGSTYDPTILTRSIPGHAFIANQGTGNFADFVKTTNGCVYPDTEGTGSFTDMWAAVELPDGARIKRLTFFGADFTTSTIFVQLFRGETRVPFIVGTPTHTSSTVASFDTQGFNGVMAVSSPDNLNEVTGSFSVGAGGIIPTHIAHRFHYLEVSFGTASGINHRLCGVEVEYQVPVSSADQGSVFFPLTGYRAYDSRLEMAPTADGVFTGGESRVIPVKDGRDIDDGIINLPNAIPTTATAVTYTVTAVAPKNFGFLFVAPGDAPEITASSLNWGNNVTGAIANSGTVKLDSNRQIKVFAGGTGSTTQFIIDITGYYAPTQHPNMAN